MDWKEWCARAVEHVRFKPDRAAIERELAAHYEDHKRDLERIGYEPKLAAERALRAMGDADAVGEALNRVHKPWLGWLWEASRVLVLLTAMLILGTAAFSGYGWGSVRYWTLFSHQQEDPYADFDMEKLVCPAPIRAGDYTIAVDRVRYWAGENGQAYLFLDVTCTTWKPWLEGPDLTSRLEALDSSGTLYRYGHAPWIVGFNDDSHIFSQGSITVERIEGQPEWIEIIHPIGGWSLRVELPGKEEKA